jgi:GNAT superfamily N-acetyltransferase
MPPGIFRSEDDPMSGAEGCEVPLLSISANAVYYLSSFYSISLLNSFTLSKPLMTTAPPQFPLPHGETLTLRPVIAADDEFLLAVYDSTRADELAQAEWQPGQREAFLKWQFDLQRGEYDRRFPDAEYFVIEIDGQPAGRIWIGQDEKQMRLLDIALLPEFQNRGAGTSLLKWLIDRARACAKPLRHMVFVLNNDADRFYERLGFVVIEDLGGYKHMEWNVGQEQ